MIKITGLKLPIGFETEDIRKAAAKKLNISAKDIQKIKLLKRSIDARKGRAFYVVTAAVSTKNEQQLVKRGLAVEYEPGCYQYPVCFQKPQKPVCVIGFGPAGMFAALTLSLCGVPVVVLERGKSVEERTKDVERFKLTGVLNTSSNVQFGEGGAGTFSDGKLHTGISDPRISLVLSTLAQHGAPQEILYESAPHIGTDKLIGVVKSIREKIISLGGRVLFEATFQDIITQNGALWAVEYTQNGSTHILECSAAVLAIGHSARDTFKALTDRGIAVAPKPFAVGLRIEHPQTLINSARYHEAAQKLPAADYKLVSHKGERGVYTFCMCPGGEVIAAASEENGVCVNGMSRHARDAQNSNSALLVGVTPADFGDGIMAGVEFQQKLERAAFEMGGGGYKAPVQLLSDFLAGQNSVSLGDIEPSYKPGWSFARLDELLPDFITRSIRASFDDFESKIKGYSRPDAVLTGVEARSSSPIRILRNEQLCSVSFERLYPAGEGAGYAGGITSAAVDGIKCAEEIIKKINAEA